MLSRPPHEPVQAIKVALGHHLRSLGYRTGRPEADALVALDIFLPITDYDYVGNILFRDDHCLLRSDYNGPHHRILRLDYCQPDLLEQLEASLAAIVLAHMRHYFPPGGTWITHDDGPHWVDPAVLPKRQPGEAWRPWHRREDPTITGE